LAAFRTNLRRVRGATTQWLATKRAETVAAVGGDGYQYREVSWARDTN
jgi:hypothetical protein